MRVRVSWALTLALVAWLGSVVVSQVRVNGVGSTVFSTAVETPTVNTGQGPNELYDMDQNVLTTSTPNFTGLISTVAGIGTTSTTGFQLINTTDAAAGAQQKSPRSCWDGEGWKTDATAASQPVSFCVDVLPIQGAAAPTAQMLFQYSVNGGAYSTVATISSTGSLTMPVTVLGANVAATATMFMGTTLQTLTIDGVTTGVVTSSRMRLVCTGTETLTTLTGGSTGMFLELLNDDTECTLDDTDAATANTFSLTGANVDEVGTTGERYLFIHDGTQWQQVGESDNL